MLHLFAFRVTQHLLLVLLLGNILLVLVITVRVLDGWFDR
jgi:hypothetical protein